MTDCCQISKRGNTTTTLSQKDPESISEIPPADCSETMACGEVRRCLHTGSSRLVVDCPDCSRSHQGQEATIWTTWLQFHGWAAHSLHPAHFAPMLGPRAARLRVQAHHQARARWPHQAPAREATESTPGSSDSKCLRTRRPYLETWSARISDRSRWLACACSLPSSKSKVRTTATWP